MIAFRKTALVAALALSSMTAGAAGAQAAPVWNPDNVPVSGFASDPTWQYGGVTVVCPESLIAGATGTSSSAADFELEFGPPGECTVNGGSATASCSGTVRVQVWDAIANVGTARLNSGFQCVFIVPFTCSITISGPQNPPLEDSFVELIGEGTDAHLDVGAVTFNASRSGTSFCGASSGGATWDALYDLDPDEISWDDEAP